LIADETVSFGPPQFTTTLTATVPEAGSAGAMALNWVGEMYVRKARADPTFTQVEPKFCGSEPFTRSEGCKTRAVPVLANIAPNMVK
jgi:hypothetical protein